MHVWIVLLSLLMPTHAAPIDEEGMTDAGPMRYRGIERLLAKFEAQEPPKADQKR